MWSLHFSAVARFELKGISVLASAWSHFQLLLGDGEQMFGSASLLYRRQLNTAECLVNLTFPLTEIAEYCRFFTRTELLPSVPLFELLLSSPVVK